MPPGNFRPSDEQWLRHQDFIRRSYILEDKSKLQVSNELSGLGFPVSADQLTKKLREWNLRKLIRYETWTEIDICIMKRKMVGKDSEVILCGKRQNHDTIRKATREQGDRSRSDQFNLQPDGSAVITTDPHVSVSTPPSFPYEFGWPDTLPWFKFPETEIKIMLNDYMGAINAIHREALVAGILHQGSIGVMNTVQFNVPKLAAVIESLMPESYPQQSLQRAHSVMNGWTLDFMCEIVSIVAYVLSNNLLNIVQEDEWRSIVNILKLSGLFKMHTNLKTLKSHTIDGFMENLYNATISRIIYTNDTNEQTDNMVLLNWLLSVGQSPTLPRESGFWCRWWPIEGPAGPELISDLLDAGASPDLKISDTHILELIILQQSTSSVVVFRIVELLLERGALVRFDYALHAAIRRSLLDPGLIEIILRYGGNPLAELDYTDEPNYEWPSRWRNAQNLVKLHTALSIAAVTGLSQTRYVLDLLRERNPQKPITEYITADVLISAVFSENYDTVNLLSRFGRVGLNDFGISPLHAAAYVGDLDIFKIFFIPDDIDGLDVTSIFTPLHFACLGASVEVVHFLIEKGANVNAVTEYWNPHERRSTMGRLGTLFKNCDATPFGLLIGEEDLLTIQKRVLECANLLIRAGATPDKKAVILAAVNLDLALLSALLNAGADPNERTDSGSTTLQRVLEVVYKHNSEWEYAYGICNSVHAYDVVELLLDNGATLSGNEIIWAFRIKECNLVTLILERGEYLSRPDRIGTALAAAIRSEDIHFVIRLFLTMPVYNAGSLCIAIQTQQTSIIQMLLGIRCTQSVTHELEVTAIGMAAQSGNIDVLRSLLQHPPPRKIGPMPILENRNPRYTDGLFEVHTEYEPIYGPGFNSLCLWGSPLAPMATKNDDKTFEACSMLLRNGFKPDRLTWAVAADSNNLAFVQFLFDNGQRYENDNEHVNDQPETQSPLLGAIRHNNKKLAGLLIAAGVDANDYRTSVSNDRSPLQLAVALGNFELVRFLVEANANVNSPPADEFGATVLQMAAFSGHLRIAKYLLDRRAAVNVPGSEVGGRTALEGAAEWGRLDMLELLWSNGDRTTESWRRHAIRAVALAVREHHYAAAEFLKESMGWSEEDETAMQQLHRDRS